MKRNLLWVLSLLLISSIAFSQDTTYTPSTPFCTDTITATSDTLVIHPPDEITNVSIIVYATTGADTITVYTKPRGTGAVYTQHGVTDFATDTFSATIITSTTPKEYLIDGVNFDYIELITTDVSASTVFFVRWDLK